MKISIEMIFSFMKCYRALCTKCNALTRDFALPQRRVRELSQGKLAFVVKNIFNAKRHIGRKENPDNCKSRGPVSGNWNFRCFLAGAEISAMSREILWEFS